MKQPILDGILESDFDLNHFGFVNFDGLLGTFQEHSNVLDALADTSPSYVGLSILQLANPGSDSFLKIQSSGVPVYVAASSFEAPLTFSAPLSRSGNTISIPAATGSVNGYLTSTDWNTFNSKQAAIGFTPENVANKVTAFSSPTDTQYPSAKLVNDQLALRQPLASNLTSWAAITRAAGFDTFTATPTVANFKSLLSDETTIVGNLLSLANPSVLSFFQINANNTITTQTAGAQRAALGLAIGTDVQAYDADLTSLAAASGTNTIYYRSAANTWSAVTVGSNLTFSAGILAGSGDALTTNPLSQFAATTSAQLAGVISDETGTGSLVFANGPHFPNGILVISSGTILNLFHDVDDNGIAIVLPFAQTVDQVILTIPDFAGVDDEFTFKTKAQTLSNKTFVAPVLGTPSSGNASNLTNINIAAANVTGRIGSANLPLGAQLYDNAGIPKLAADFGARSLAKNDGSTILSWDSGDGFLVFGNSGVVFSAIDGVGNDASSILAINWTNRQLIANDGSTVALDWSEPTGIALFTDAIIMGVDGTFSAGAVFATTFTGDGSALTNVTPKVGSIGSVIAGTKTATGTATTTFTVTIGVTMANTTYKVTTEGDNALSSAVHYVNNKTTTSFDIVYLAGLTGSVAVDWIVSP